MPFASARVPGKVGFVMDTLVSPSSRRSSGITTRDVAARARVAQASVSAVLNGGSGRCVSPATRQRILDAAEELGYRRNHAASVMRTGNTQMLGWLGGNLGEEHVGKMLSGALEAADLAGYTLKILRLGELGNALQVIRRSSELRLMGMLALHLPVATQNDLHDEAMCYGYPLVFMDERSERTDVPQVVSDDEGGIELGIEHLVKLGHQRIAFISAGEEASVLSSSREQGFLRAMGKRGLDVPPHWIAHGSFSSREPSLQAARSLLGLRGKRRPTAVLCSGDFIALATLQVAREMGLSVPQELSIVGFANMNVGEFATPQLTTIEQPFMDIGRKAVHVLLSVIESRIQRDGAAPVTLEEHSARFETPFCLPTRLIERASTAPPRN